MEAKCGDMLQQVTCGLDDEETNCWKCIEDVILCRRESEVKLHGGLEMNCIFVYTNEAHCCEAKRLASCQRNFCTAEVLCFML